MKLSAFLIIFILLIIPGFAAAELFSTQTASAISSQTQIPVEWLTSWWKFVLYVVLPVWALWYVSREIMKEVGVFSNNSVNNVLALVFVGFLIPQGLFGYVVKIASKTEAMMFVGAGILSFLVVLKIRRSIASVGYSGVLSGVLVYVLDGAGVGILFGVIGYLISGMVWGPPAMTAAMFGVALGMFLVFWEKRKKTSLGEVKTLLSKEEKIEENVEELMKKADELQKRIAAESNSTMKAQLMNEFTEVMKLIEMRRAQQEYIEMKEEASVA
ncbi:MAG: hypothetical protein V1731_00080 [Candidatus Aenigmatarchaeota archaeon]